MRRVLRTWAGSFLLGDLPRGCELCMHGLKLVLLITGLCDKRCWYCPLSREKKGRDVIYANERSVKKFDDIVEEVESQGAEGAGITGGNPLLVFERTLGYIKLMKEVFGEDFHIHLYTAISPAFNLDKIKSLAEAGLDELRIHLMLDNPSEWKIMKKLVEKIKNCDIGVEIPVIPGYLNEIKKMIRFLDESGVFFMNMNELEFSESNSFLLQMRGFKLKEGSFSAVEGSHETAMEALKWAEKNVSKLNMHYCPAFIKDSVQYKNRLIRTAKRVRRPHEKVTDEGTLVKLVLIPPPELELSAAALLVERVIGEAPYLNLPRKCLEVDPDYYDLVDELKKHGFRCFLVEEYPTYGRKVLSRVEL